MNEWRKDRLLRRIENRLAKKSPISREAALQRAIDVSPSEKALMATPVARPVPSEAILNMIADWCSPYIHPDIENLILEGGLSDGDL